MQFFTAVLGCFGDCFDGLKPHKNWAEQRGEMRQFCEAVQWVFGLFWACDWGLCLRCFAAVRRCVRGLF